MLMLFRICLLLLVLASCSDSGTTPENKETIVQHFGPLQVSGTNLVDQNGDTIALHGMSLFWSQWGEQYYNRETIKWLVDDWKCTVVRAAIGIENSGYLDNPQYEMAKLYNVIDACIDLGIYVIVDWHDHHAQEHLSQAVEFFKSVSSKYGKYPNIIYETYNEPLDLSWDNVLKPYTDSLVAVIRKNDPVNIIIAGTPNWSQDVDAVIGETINDPNVVYSLHFYTGTHFQWLRDKATLALNAGVPLYISEWGLSEASGSGEINRIETDHWIKYMDDNNLSSCNWSVTNKDESSAALLPGTSALSGWTTDELSQSGIMIRDFLISRNSQMFEILK